LLVAALFAVGLAAAFPQVVFGSRTFAPNGRLPTQSGAARADYPYERPSRAVVNDGGAFVWFFEPTAAVVGRAWRDGAPPLWNPYAGTGTPLAADLQSAPAGPFYWPVYVHSSQRVWDFVALLRLLVGGVGCFALLRALGARPAAAFVPAVGYLLASAFVLWILSVSLSVEALLPWLLLAVVGVARRGGAGPFAALALLVAAAALGGQPESLVVVAYVIGAWALFWWIKQGRAWRALAELAGAALTGGLLAAPQLLLAGAYIPEAVDAHGGKLGDARLSLSAFREVLLGDYVAKKQAGVGIGLLVLAATGLAGRRVAGAWLLAGVATVWAVRALDVPGQQVVGLLPGIDAVNIRRYGLVVLVLAVAVLAGAGLEAILDGSRPALVLVGSSLALPLVLWASGAPRGDAVRALILAILVAAVALLVSRRPALAPLLAVALVLQFALLTPRAYAKRYDPFRPEPFVSFLRARLAPGDRVIGLGVIMRPQYPSALGVPDLRVEDALYPKRYERYVSTLAGALPAQHSSFAGYITSDQAASPFLAAAAVRYVVAPAAAGPPGAQFRAVYRSTAGRALVIWENEDALPRAWLARRVVAADDQGQAERELARAGAQLRNMVVVEKPTDAMRSAGAGGRAVVEKIGWNEARFRVHAEGPAVLVTSDLYLPGWSATVDGRSATVRPANLAMRAVAVPAGEHTVVFRYRPNGFRYGVVLALVGALALLARAGVPRVTALRARP
jgi:hypothetical protein